MIKFVKVIERIETPIVKIRGITSTGEYAEVRLKPIPYDLLYSKGVKVCSLDVRVSKEEGSNMRRIYQQDLIKYLSLDEVIKYLEIQIEEESDVTGQENSNN